MPKHNLPKSILRAGPNVFLEKLIPEACRPWVTLARNPGDFQQFALGDRQRAHSTPSQWRSTQVSESPCLLMRRIWKKQEYTKELREKPTSAKLDGHSRRYGCGEK